MKTKSLFNLTLAAFSILFVASVFGAAIDVQPIDVVKPIVITGAVFTTIRFVILVVNPESLGQRPRVITGVFTEIWDQVLAENLYRKYDWLMKAKDRTANVLNNAVVHIPQAGAVPRVYRNRVQYPVNVNKRVDSDITYALDVFSSDASHLTDAEKKELNYNKIQNILQDHINEIGKQIGYNALYRWFGAQAGGTFLNAANIVRTTGASTAGLNVTGATGNRNKFLVADVATAKQTLITQTKQEINDGRRALILQEAMYTQLKGDPILTTLYNLPVVGAQFSNNGDLVRLHGFDIIRTDVLPRFSNTPQAKDPLDPTVVNAATDNDCALLVDFDKVHIAKGAAQIFQNDNDALMQGDLYSGLARSGASRERNDQAGVIAIVQQ